MFQKGLAVIKKFCTEAPEGSGIYKMLGINGEILYIGKAKNLKKRVASYANVSNHPIRLKRMVNILNKIEYITTPTEAQALLLEANLIKTHQPRFNINLKDDKSFPFIMIDKGHEYPRICKYRGKKNKSFSYFGPFANVKYVNETIKELQKIFMVRPCSDAYFASRKRPCLQYEIKRCSAPCVNKISQKNYAISVKQCEDFLNGKSTDLQKYYTQKMEQASEEMHYELAAKYRDKIRMITQIQISKTVFGSVENGDIISYYEEDSKACIQIFFIRTGNNYGNRNYFFDLSGIESKQDIIENLITNIYSKSLPPKNLYITTKLDNKKTLEEGLQLITGENIKVINKIPNNIEEFALENAKEALKQHRKEQMQSTKTLAEIAKKLHLTYIPDRIEIYDNSHIQGENAVGCMVVAGRNGFEKNQYRKFNIKTVKKGDDYGMLTEVLNRRLKKLNGNNYPDLMLIDGGIGHLNTANKVLKEHNISDINVVAIAKGANRNAKDETFYIEGHAPIKFAKHDKCLFYLQTLRDEVHRFAITSHRSKQRKSLQVSAIDKIPNIGRERKKLLLQHFGSIEELRNAGAKDIANLSGFGLKIAEKIVDYLHN